MLLPSQGIYPDFPSDTTLENLLFTVARKILSVQKSSTNNPNELEKITLSIDETESTANIGLTELRASVASNGNLAVVDPFSSVTFAAGTGNYPYNRESLLDCFFHLCLYQSGLETDSTINTDLENSRYIDISVLSTESPSLFPLVISVTVENYPLAIATNGLAAASPYLDDV